MTDKKKLDEQAILNVQNTNDGITSDTTFVADDAVALAQLLKSAGIESAMFNGPAMLSVEETQGTSSMTSRVTAPDLRSIMNLLEPEFQAAGDMEAGVQDMEAGVQDMEATMDLPADEPCVDGACDAPVDAIDPIEPEVDMGMDLEQDDVEEAAMVEYPGIADKKPVQPATKQVPARSGDNPLKSFRDYVEEAGKKDKKRSGVPAFGTFYPVGFRHDNEDHGQDTSDELGFDVGGADMFGEEEINELSGDLKGRYASKAQASKDKHEKRAGELDDLVHDAHSAEKMGVIRKGAGDRVARERNRHDRTAWKREKGLDRVNGYTAEDLMQEFRVDELSNDTKNSYFKKAAASIDGHAVHAANQRGIGNDDQAGKHDAKIMKRAQGMNRAIAKEEELDEVSRNDWKSKVSQYGQPYYLNTDCGYASLEAIMQGEGLFDEIPTGLASHATKIGFTVLEIERNGKTGYNFINSPDNLQPGTKVTCVTQTSTGQKCRPGKFIASFSTKDLSMNYDQVVAELAKLGITPSKKLPVKTFD